MTQLPRLKVKVTGQGQRIYPWISCLLHISWTLEAIFINLHPNISLCEIMCRTYDLASQTQGQCHVIYPSICVHSISPKLFELVSLNFIQIFLIHLNFPLSETVCRAHNPATLTQGQGTLPFYLCPLHISLPHRSILIRLHSKIF